MKHNLGMKMTVQNSVRYCPTQKMEMLIAYVNFHHIVPLGTNTFCFEKKLTYNEQMR